MCNRLDYYALRRVIGPVIYFHTGQFNHRRCQSYVHHKGGVAYFHIQVLRIVGNMTELQSMTARFQGYPVLTIVICQHGSPGTFHADRNGRDRPASFGVSYGAGEYATKGAL